MTRQMARANAFRKAWNSLRQTDGSALVIDGCFYSRHARRIAARERAKKKAS